MRNMRFKIIVLIGSGLILISAWYLLQFLISPQGKFSGRRSYQDVVFQTNLGPRTPGSPAHQVTGQWIQTELEEAGWQVEIQDTYWMGFPLRNIIGRRTDAPPEIILGAHYDSRMISDRAEDAERDLPVPGANDGASGVAVLLELARTLPEDTAPLWFVFFDAEDNGGLDGRDWIMGSRAFVAHLSEYPTAVVIVDMVGDRDLNIYREYNSSPVLTAEIWSQANALGYGAYFIPQDRHSLLDDHTPFLEVGIPAVVIIDFDYPYWHTPEDTAAKVSPLSLEIVGNTLWAWIVTFP